MKQLDAIDKITEILKNDDAVRAIFLKGSIARNCMDDYSDVDYYCIVKNEKMDDFLKRRIDCLSTYRSIIFWSESNFVGPQIVAVFDDGLHFDLYTIRLEMLQQTDEIKVIFDPENLLENYKSVSLKIDEKDVIRFFNEFSFSLLEFEAAYCRQDLLWASRLASHLSGDLAMVLRYLYDVENSKLGFKRLNKVLDAAMLTKMENAMDKLGPKNLPEGVILLVKIAAEILDRLPRTLYDEINIKFFDFMSNKIKNLGE